MSKIMYAVSFGEKKIRCASRSDAIAVAREQSQKYAGEVLIEDDQANERITYQKGRLKKYAFRSAR